jgi:hypothetical protein
MIRGETGCGDLRVRRFESSRAIWNRLVDFAPNATLYHSDRWLDLLAQSYRLEISLATIERYSEIRAACVLARSRNPLSIRFVSLPFSDFCPPLARDDDAMNDLLKGLTINPEFRKGCELRGVKAAKPWQTVDVFANWNLNLQQPLRALERGLRGNFRRNLRRAAELRVSIERGSRIEHIERFYALQLETRRRLGVPSQPIKMYRLLRQLFPKDSLEVWLASHKGRDEAGVIVLRYRDRIYYKWGARRVPALAGINHVLFWSLIEEFAGKVSSFDLGRADIRNEGLSRFKRELGARSDLVPYSYFPTAPHHASAEVLSGTRKFLSRVWQHLPLPATRALGAAFYSYLA